MDLLRLPLVSDQINKAELAIILRELQTTQAVAGDVVEFGCYVGTTSLFLQRVLSGTGKMLHVYDSFEGLPAKTAQDENALGAQYKQGELATSKAQLVKHFRQAGLPLPVMHKGWFNELTPRDVPQRISFAYLDGDFYHSILDSLRLVWSQLTPGAKVVIDDYGHQALPGAKRAVDQWLQTHAAALRVEASLAVLTPHLAR